jgi:hypothetical protein
LEQATMTKTALLDYLKQYAYYLLFPDDYGENVIFIYSYMGEAILRNIPTLTINRRGIYFESILKYSWDGDLDGYTIDEFSQKHLDTLMSILERDEFIRQYIEAHDIQDNAIVVKFRQD